MIVNPGPEDYHMHTLQFSDGLNTIDEMVIYAQKVGLKKMVFTDHSDAAGKTYGRGIVGSRIIIPRWRNVHNAIEVGFGVEADILDNFGKVSTTIQDRQSDFVILSAHPGVFKGLPEAITGSYIAAIRMLEGKVDCIGHPDANYFSQYLNMRDLVAAANDYGIPLEFNCSNFVYDRTDRGAMETMLERADRIMVNSDAHTLHELEHREKGLQYLRSQGLL